MTFLVIILVKIFIFKRVLLCFCCHTLVCSFFLLKDKLRHNAAQVSHFIQNPRGTHEQIRRDVYFVSNRIKRSPCTLSLSYHILYIQMQPLTTHTHKIDSLTRKRLGSLSNSLQTNQSNKI